MDVPENTPVYQSDASQQVYNHNSKVSFSPMQKTQATIINDILDKQAYKATYPKLVGKSDHKALHELHVFLLSVNPSQDIIDLALEATDKYNHKYAHELNGYPLKMCFLTSLFKSTGHLKVLETARYFRSDDQDEVITEIYKDAAFYQECGFDIVRIKIEANVHSTKGLPITDEEAKESPQYFEVHVKVQQRTAQDSPPVSKEEEQALADVSESMHIQSFTRILSFNYDRIFASSANRNHARKTQDIKFIRPNPLKTSVYQLYLTQKIFRLIIILNKIYIPEQSTHDNTITIITNPHSC